MESRCRVSPIEVAHALRLRLAAELVEDRAALDALAAAVARLLPPAADERGEWMRGLALAFEIERFYTAVEATLARVLRALDGEVPSGSGWHQDLLRAAAVEVKGGRPALVSQAAVRELRELLKFRHLARHGYESEPELGRMTEHAARVLRIQPEMALTFGAVDAWLTRIK
jgi:hypothetical protein